MDLTTALPRWSLLFFLTVQPSKAGPVPVLQNYRAGAWRNGFSGEDRAPAGKDCSARA